MPGPLVLRIAPAWRAVLTLATLAAGTVATACGGDAGGDGELTVSAAASLTTAFERYADERRLDAQFSFAGSDRLAAQIRSGARPDVYAAADDGLTRSLHADGLVGAPATFATGSLVIAVPDGSPIDSLADLGSPGTEVVVGTPSAPVGSYARELLDRLDAATRERIEANVRSEEPDVNAIVGKLTQGGADAGLLYRSDVVAAAGRLEAVAIPARVAPEVAYAAAVVEGAPNPRQAEAFVEGLTTATGRRVLDQAGLDPESDDRDGS